MPAWEVGWTRPFSWNGNRIAWRKSTMLRVDELLHDVAVNARGTERGLLGGRQGGNLHIK